MKKSRKPARKWAYSEELLREIAATPGSYAELARRYDVHTETVTRAKRLYRVE